MIPFDRTLIAAVVIAVTTTACGGGGGGSSTAAATPPPTSGGTGGDTGGTGGDTGGDTDGDNGDTDNGDAVVNAKDVAFGTITQFGSIFVNGVKYDTSTAKIIIEGVEKTEDDLGVGMVVFVQGTVNEDGVTGVAEVVIVDDNLKGPISAVTPATDDAGNPLDARQITVLGIDVIVERTGTVFEGTTFENITVGEFVEVYGFNEAGNNVRATRVQARAFVADTTEIEVYGTAVAGSIDAGVKSFLLGEYTVDYSAADVTDLAGGDPSEGVLLEVKGTLASPDALVITASKVEPASFNTGGADDVPADPTSAATEKMSVEGAVGNYNAEANTFTINGFTVDASTATLKPSTLVLTNGAVVQAKGSYDGEILKATEIESRRGQIEVEGSVSAIDSDNNTVTISLGGGRSVTITVDNRTLFDDDRSSKDRRFGFDDVRTGDYLEVEAVNLGEGVFMATRIDREDEDEDEVEIQAPVESFEPSISVTLLGMTFTVDGRTEYELANGNEVSAAAFFGALDVGALIKVEDEDLDGVADEIEFESQGKLAGSEFVDSDDDSDDDISDDDISDDDSSDDDSSDDDISDDDSSDDDSSDDDSSDDDSSDDDSSDDDSSDDDSSDDDSSDDDSSDDNSSDDDSSDDDSSDDDSSDDDSSDDDRSDDDDDSSDD